MKITAILHLEVESQHQFQTSWKWESTKRMLIFEEIHNLYIFRFVAFLLNTINAEAFYLQYQANKYPLLKKILLLSIQIM